MNIRNTMLEQHFTRSCANHTHISSQKTDTDISFLRFKQLYNRLIDFDAPHLFPGCKLNPLDHIGMFLGIGTAKYPVCFYEFNQNTFRIRLVESYALNQPPVISSEQMGALKGMIHSDDNIRSHRNLRDRLTSKIPFPNFKTVSQSDHG